MSYHVPEKPPGQPASQPLGGACQGSELRPAGTRVFLRPRCSRLEPWVLAWQHNSLPYMQVTHVADGTKPGMASLREKGEKQVWMTDTRRLGNT